MKTSLSVASAVIVGFTLLFAACGKDKKPAASKPGEPAKAEPAKPDEPKPAPPTGGGW